MIGKYQFLLFDLCETLMFGVDKFDDTQDYYHTYQSCGGNELDSDTVNDIVSAWFEVMLAHYRDEKYYDDFKDALYYLEEVAPSISGKEKTILEQVIAKHEIGYIPQTSIDTIQDLSKHFTLGLISNIWSRSTFFMDTLKQSGLENCFQTIVFSSDYDSIKPSPRLFEIALDQLNAPKEQAIYIGDSLSRDVIGAKNSGLDVIWLQGNQLFLDELQVKPDYILENVTALASIIDHNQAHLPQIP